MQYTSILYLIGSFSAFPPIMGVLLLVLPFLILTKRILIRNSRRVYVAVAVFVAISLAHLFLNLDYFSGGLVLHLVFLMSITLLLRDKTFCMSSFIKCIKVITVVNLVFIFLYFVPPLRTILYFDMAGFYRFRGAYLEPSIAAIAAIFHIIILWQYSPVKNNKIFILINLLIVIITFSGSGFLLLAIMLFSNFIKKIKLSKIVFMIVACLSAYILIFEVLEDTFLHLRIVNMLNGNFSQSTYLRFFAPFEFIHALYDSDLYSFFFGISDPRLYIESNYSIFQYFYLWDGTKTYQVNNGYAVLWALSGFVGVIIFFTFMFFHWRNRNIVYNSFFIFLPFFTGHFVSILFWFYIFIFIEINRRNYLSTK